MDTQKISQKLDKRLKVWYTTNWFGLKRLDFIINTSIKCGSCKSTQIEDDCLFIYKEDTYVSYVCLYCGCIGIIPSKIGEPTENIEWHCGLIYPGIFAKKNQ